MKQPKYIFIGGAGRSGTTLMQKVILAHPKIAGGPEFYYTKPIFELYEKMRQGLSASVFHPSIDEESLKDQFVKTFNSFFQPYFSSDICYVSEKTPTNIKVASTLLNVFKDALFIHVYRDGRAVLNSHFQVKKRAWENGKNLTEINLIDTSVYWNKCIDAYLKVENEFNHRLISICYEDMIAQPEETFKKVFDFLGLEIHNQIQDIHKIKPKDNKGEAHINDIWYTREMYQKPYDTVRINEWKKEMNFFRKFIGTSIMYKFLNKMGYETNNFHKIGNLIFYFFYHFKNNIKSLKVFYPVLYLKRRMQ